MKLKSFLNYFGQLRLYSFLDLLVFATALTRDWKIILGIGLLWLSFLLYLESRHNDQPRLKINGFIYVVPFLASIFLVPIWVCFGFALVSYFYTKKKQNKFFGISAPVWRGLQNGIIASAFNFQLAILALVLILIRNLIADFRDARDDRTRGIKTIPVIMGVQQNQTWSFYIHIMFVLFTTLIWFNFSFLGKNLILPIILMQFISYPLTPRPSNPKYLDIYSE